MCHCWTVTNDSPRSALPLPWKETMISTAPNKVLVRLVAEQIGNAVRLELSVRLECVCICRVTHGRIAEIWWAYDAGVLVRQMGPWTEPAQHAVR